MWYSTEPRKRKYVEGYGLLSFAKKFGDKYGKKVMDTGTKSEKILLNLYLEELFKKQQKHQEV